VLGITGLHHITAIAGPAQRSVDFHTRALERRLVKRTVNFDEPHIYHLYFGDENARPGSIFTVFPFEHAVPGSIGVGTATGFAYRTSIDTLEAVSVAVDDARPFVRFGERGLRMHDPDGVPVEIVAPIDADEAISDAPLHSVTLTLKDAAPSIAFLTEVFGYTQKGQERDEEGRRIRLETPGKGPGRVIDLVQPEIPTIAKSGAGSIHHVAFRAETDDELAAWREAVHEWGLTPTPVMDRQYFRSIYFVEPGGVLFEIATDPPGFTVDEPPEALGKDLKLPPRYEPRRREIEASLPHLRPPEKQGAA
jgi:glyoxalase family protein